MTKGFAAVFAGAFMGSRGRNLVGMVKGEEIL